MANPTYQTPAWLKPAQGVVQNKPRTNVNPAWMQNPVPRLPTMPTGTFFSNNGQTVQTPAWMKTDQARVPYEKLPNQPTGTFFSGGANYNVKQGEVPYDPRLLASGYYKTGEDQRMTIRKNDGSVIRMTPNSYLSPAPAAPKTKWQQFLDGFNKPAAPSGVTGVRG